MPRKLTPASQEALSLPSYTLVNLGFNYQMDQWHLGFNLKNVTDEEYFRSNFPNLFGGTIVLPELPRHFAATLRSTRSNWKSGET